MIDCDARQLGPLTLEVANCEVHYGQHIVKAPVQGLKGPLSHVGPIGTKGPGEKNFFKIILFYHYLLFLQYFFHFPWEGIIMQLQKYSVYMYIILIEGPSGNIYYLKNIILVKKKLFPMDTRISSEFLGTRVYRPNS